jgi:hypothetical protein
MEMDGTVHPRRFLWQEGWLDVSDVGRQWVDESGRHVLVMVAGRLVFELLLERENLTWHVVQTPDQRTFA